VCATSGGERGRARVARAQRARVPAFARMETEPLAQGFLDAGCVVPRVRLRAPHVIGLLSVPLFFATPVEVEVLPRIISMRAGA
jgi:hypothetical protein